jgi:hypothetical protein
MHHRNDTAIGFISGIVGAGIRNYVVQGSILLQVQHSFAYDMFKSGFTAFLCGVAGVAGKHLYDIFLKGYVDNLKNRFLKKKTDETISSGKD